MRNLQNLVSKYKTPDANFPDGSAKDDVVAGDKTGTELVASWVNELLQAGYALIRNVHDIPNNIYEKPGVSQVVDSIKKWMVRNALMNFRDLQATGFALAKLAIERNDNYFVIVGTGGAIITSPESEDWTSQTSGTGQQLNDIELDEDTNKLLVVGNGAIILTASDPTGTWTIETPPVNDDDYFGCDIGSASFWLICGVNTGIGAISISDDQGSTWESVIDDLGGGSIGTTEYLNSILATPYLVACGDNGAIVKSDNVVNWPLQTSGTTEHLYDIDYSPCCDRIVICGANSTILTSDNGGTTWTSRLAPVAGLNLFSVNWIFEANAFLIVGESGNMLISHDGITWKKLVVSATADLQDVVFSANIGLAVACGTGGNITQSQSVFPDGL